MVRCFSVLILNILSSWLDYGWQTFVMFKEMNLKRHWNVRWLCIFLRHWIMFIISSILMLKITIGIFFLYPYCFVKLIELQYGIPKILLGILCMVIYVIILRSRYIYEMLGFANYSKLPDCLVTGKLFVEIQNNPVW